MEKPSPELTQKNPKKKLDGLYTVGPGNKMFFIPEKELARFEVPDSSVPPHDPVPEPQTDEVSGRHAVPLRSGYIGWHSDWLVGPYIWHRDGGSYHGVHRHPWGNIFAIDPDDL